MLRLFSRLPTCTPVLRRFRSARSFPTSTDRSPDDPAGNFHHQPSHLEASRHIFSSQCIQNRPEAKASCKLDIFLSVSGNSFKRQPQPQQQREDHKYGGAERDRTADPLLAKQVLSQLSYSPILRSRKCVPRSKLGIKVNSKSTIPKARRETPIQARGRRQSFGAPTQCLRHVSAKMVGPGRLELPTPRLSSVCSNQLSYGPIPAAPSWLPTGNEGRHTANPGHRQQGCRYPQIKRGSYPETGERETWTAQPAIL